MKKLLVLFLVPAISFGQVVVNKQLFNTRNNGIVQLAATKNADGSQTLTTIGTGTDYIVSKPTFLTDRNGAAVKLSGTFNSDGTFSLATSGGGVGSNGTVTNFTSGNLSPLFTTSVATPATTPALTFSLSNANANTIFGNFTGGSAAPSYNAIGSGVAVALGINTGSAGAFVVNGGALGTPSSGTLTNATGLPIGGITGLGTGVGTALGVNVGTAGAFVVNGGALGTPSSGVATNLTGTASGLTSGNVTTNANLTGVITSVGNATSTGAQTGTGNTFVMAAGSPTISGVLTLSPPARTSGSANYLTLNIPADTTLTAATESIGYQHVTATRQFAGSGTIALQRENFWAGPTYSSVSASTTFTDPFTFYLTPPIAGTNAIFTREHTFGILDSTSASSSITGGFIVATTLGTSATSVGIGGGNINAGGTITGNSFTGAGTGLTGTGASFTAGNVTTNANLTGVITSVGNATSTGAQTGTGSTFVMSAGSPVINTPVITGGMTGSGSGANDLSGSSGTFKTSTGGVTIGPGAISETGVLTLSPPVRTSGTSPYLTINTPADTGQTAATESIGIQLTSASRQWATTGTIALQEEVRINGPTYTSASASQTFTDVFTWSLTPPIAGSNAIFTRGHTLGVIDSTSSSSAITGGFIVAATPGTAISSVGIGGGNINAGNNINASGAANITGAVQAGSVTINASAGGIGNPPLNITAGTNVSTPTSGNIEYDGTNWYHTTNTTQSRAVDDQWQFFRLTGSGSGITTIADFFGATGSGIPMIANGVYEVEWHCYFSQATAGTATWTITTATTALATLTAEYNGSNIAGIGAVGANQTAAVNVTSSSATAMPATGTEATGVTHYFVIHAICTAGNGASNTRLRLTMSAGTATPLINSYFKVRRLPAANVGTFSN